VSDIRQQLLAAFELEHRDHLEAIRRALTSPAQADVREMFRRVHSLKGAARAVDLPQVEALAHELEELLAGPLESGAALDEDAVDRLHQGLDLIEAAAAPKPAHAASDERAVEYLRVDADLVGRIGAAVHQISSEAQGLPASAARLRAFTADLRRLSQAWSELRAPATSKAREFEQALKSLTARASELTQRQAYGSWALEQSLASARREVEAVALVPAEDVFGDLGRMVRDVARERGMAVDVDVSGLAIRAERRVLQALRDPLIHMLRNALGHGAESPQARQAAGKPERMRIELSLRTNGGLLEITVADDGAGPDLARLEAAAIAKRLLPARTDDQQAPAPEELLALAFSPGLSAATAVDELSGRGMGLSAAQSQIRGVGGAVRLARRAPHGTIVEITAPLSAARQALVIAEAGPATYALPSFAVARLLRLPLHEVGSLEGAAVIRLKAGDADLIIPLATLSALAGQSTREIPSSGGYVQVILMARGNRRLALAVDGVRDAGDSVVEALSPVGMDGFLTLGATLVDDDLAIPVLNPDALLDRWLADERRLAVTALATVSSEAPSRPRSQTVLVVDDSITTRTLEKSILEAQGYRVLVAVDGLEALGLLRSGEAVVDLVLADVEMPRMDGFGLLQVIKSDPSLGELPVILMTSKDDPADVQRGMELGADAYLTKQKFDQRELLATIGRVL
jgi:two-component system chemotaxis sensor kinase CheA